MDTLDLQLCTNPSRYIGQELNSISKDHSRVSLKTVLCFPDLYEIGMSHLGLKILYKIINDHPDALAERVFAPACDMEELLRSKKEPLTSLETNTPLNNFDIIGFSMLYELCCTNILTILDLGKIPLLSGERTDDNPIIIAGGPAAVNPMPLSRFIDLFCIGDGEELIVDIVDAVIGAKKKNLNRKETLQKLSKIEGVFVPSLQTARVRKRIVYNLDKSAFPEKIIVPYKELVHDRVAIEIARGCMSGCRFCQAGYTYRPYRERKADTIIRLAETQLKNTGYDTLSLLALNCSSHSQFRTLTGTLTMYPSRHISVSLPSQRIDHFNAGFAEDIAGVKKTGFTFAPETGTERLRNVINKSITDEEIYRVVNEVFSLGWQKLKLYFMIGLPTETEDDLDSILRMVREVKKIGNKYHGRKASINVTISVFSPKPHTPFQWFSPDPVEVLYSKINYLRNLFSGLHINMKYSSPREAEVETLLSQGDSRVGDWIYEVWKMGERFSAWREHFQFERWVKAGESLGYDFDMFIRDKKSPGSEFPWDFVDIHVKKSYLLNEWNKSLEGQKTPDCFGGRCTNCGLDASKCIHKKNIDIKEPPAVILSTGDENIPQQRIRMKYSRTEPLLLISHLELTRTFLRAVRRADIPVRYSEGFNPQPDIQFAYALPVGYASSSEYLDMILVKTKNPEFVKKNINDTIPDGIKIDAVYSFAPRMNSLSSTINILSYSLIYSINPSIYIPLKQRIIDTAQDENLSVEVSGKRKKQTVMIHPQVSGIKISLMNEDKIEILLEQKMLSTRNLKPHEIVSILSGDMSKYLVPFRFERTEMSIETGGRCYSPFLYPSVNYRKEVLSNA